MISNHHIKKIRKIQLKVFCKQFHQTNLLGKVVKKVKAGDIKHASQTYRKVENYPNPRFVTKGLGNSNSSSVTDWEKTVTDKRYIKELPDKETVFKNLPKLLNNFPNTEKLASYKDKIVSFSLSINSLSNLFFINQRFKGELFQSASLPTLVRPETIDLFNLFDFLYSRKSFDESLYFENVTKQFEYMTNNNTIISNGHITNKHTNINNTNKDMTNDETNITNRQKPQYPYNIILDGSKGSGKTTLLGQMQGLAINKKYLIIPFGDASTLIDGKKNYKFQGKIGDILKIKSSLVSQPMLEREFLTRILKSNEFNFNSKLENNYKIVYDTLNVDSADKPSEKSKKDYKTTSVSKDGLTRRIELNFVKGKHTLFDLLSGVVKNSGCSTEGFNAFVNEIKTNKNLPPTVILVDNINSLMGNQFSALRYPDFSRIPIDKLSIPNLLFKLLNGEIIPKRKPLVSLSAISSLYTQSSETFLVTLGYKKFQPYKDNEIFSPLYDAFKNAKIYKVNNISLSAANNLADFYYNAGILPNQLTKDDIRAKYIASGNGNIKNFSDSISWLSS